MEKLILNRLDWYLETGNHLPHTLIGFRRHVCTEGVAFRIQEDVFAHPSTAQLHTIVGVYLKKAFNNVTHAAILYNLQETQPGSRLFNYIKDFLSKRTAQTIRPDGQPSPPSPSHAARHKTPSYPQLYSTSP